MHTKKYPAGPIETCVRKGRIDKAIGQSEHNWRHPVVCKRKDAHKMKIIQADKLNCFYCFARRRTYGWQGRCFNQTCASKSHNQLSHV